MFLAGGIGSHFGGFAEVTYEGVDRHFSWDNLDLRAVAPTHLFGTDAILGLTLNNSPTVQDPWNTLPAWGFPFTDTSVSETPAAAPVIDDALAQNVMGLSAYAWIAHSVYVELGGYSSPARGTLDFLGVDPFDPGSIHGFAPYARAAYQAKLAGGTLRSEEARSRRRYSQTGIIPAVSRTTTRTWVWTRRGRRTSGRPTSSRSISGTNMSTLIFEPAARSISSATEAASVADSIISPSGGAPCATPSTIISA